MHQDKKNSLWLAFQFIVGMLFSMIGLKLNLLTYGERIFDIWLILLSIWGVGSALDLGFGVSIVRFVAAGSQDQRKVNSIVSTGFFIFLGLGLFLYIAGSTVAELFYFPNRSLIPAELSYQARIVHYLLGINFFFQYMAIFFRSIFDGMNDFIRPVKIGLLYSVLLFFCITIVFFLKLPLIYLAIGYALVPVVQCMLFVMLLKGMSIKVSIRFSEFSTTVFKEMFSFSFSLQLTALCAALIDPIVKYLIGNYSSKGFVSVYEIARRVSIAISGLFSQSFRYVLPRTSILRTVEEYNIFLDTEGKKISSLGIGYSALFFGALSIFAVLIFKYYYGYTESIVVFFILSLSESINNTLYNLYVFIVGIGKSKYLILLQFSNLLFITLFMFLGLKYLPDVLSLFGFFLSVVISAFIMLKFVKIETNFSVVRYLNSIKIYKLVLFHLLVLLNIFSLVYNVLDLFAVQFIYFVLITVLFYTEFKQIFMLLKNMLLSQKAFT